ncbi:MAG: O-antigen ligase family protein [Candidatus Moranbacteria bacterium]|jgi:hypothetical protein|nr:O-antigen ligase family protein [Candidatus Moranbacteria bacterium]
MNNFFCTIATFLFQHRIKTMLVFVSILLGSLGLFFSLTGILPLSIGNFFFFSFLVFLIALYRPIWIFLLLISMLPYEIINLAPVEFGILLRPYQWLMLLLFAAIGTRLIARRPLFSPFQFLWIDMLPVLFSLGAYLSAFSVDFSGSSGKLSLILSSFVGLFFLVRFFVRTEKSAIHLLPFILSSFGVIACWSILQNILFAFGKESFQVMAGRPNGSFAESDWLGMYLLFPIALSLAWLYRNEVLRKKWIEMLFPLGVLFLGTLVLILSMTRSAWLGMTAMGFFFAGASLVTFFKLGNPKSAFLLIGKAGFVVCLALISVPVFHLSRFSFIDRAISTGGIQKITIACLWGNRTPGHIQNTEELSLYGCQHILLEEQAAFREAGYAIQEVGRDDPNVAIRQSVYTQVVTLIREHPFFGIGWGIVGAHLGVDNQGSMLNASNIFLEFWLGSGLVGVGAFSLLWFLYGFQSGRRTLVGGGSEVAFHLFFHLVWIGFTVFNLFNSGILLGIFFAFLGLGGVLFQKKQHDLSSNHI